MKPFKFPLYWLLLVAISTSACAKGSSLSNHATRARTSSAVTSAKAIRSEIKGEQAQQRKLRSLFN